MALGLGLGLGFGRIKSANSISAPTLTWDADETDSRPDFDVGIPYGLGALFDAADGDVLRLQYSSDSGANWSAYLTHTLTAAEIAGAPFTVNGVSPVTNGSYLFRARIERGARVSPWSANEDVTVDADNNITWYFLGF